MLKFIPPFCIDEDIFSLLDFACSSFGVGDMDGTTGAGERKLWFNEYGELVPLFLPIHNNTQKLIARLLGISWEKLIHLVVVIVERGESRMVFIKNVVNLLEAIIIAKLTLNDQRSIDGHTH